MTFRPYVFIETSELKPSSIAVAGWTGNQMKYINLPEDLTLQILSNGPQIFGGQVVTLPVQLHEIVAVQDLVRNYFEEATGQCHLYGEITGFRFVVSPTESIVLDTKGTFLRCENGQFWPRSITMKVDVAQVVE